MCTQQSTVFFLTLLFARCFSQNAHAFNNSVICSLDSLISYTQQYGQKIENYFGNVLAVLGQLRNAVLLIDKTFVFPPGGALDFKSRYTHVTIYNSSCWQDIREDRVTDNGFFNWSFDGFYFGRPIEPNWNKIYNEPFPIHAVNFSEWTDDTTTICPSLTSAEKPAFCRNEQFFNYSKAAYEFSIGVMMEYQIAATFQQYSQASGGFATALYLYSSSGFDHYVPSIPDFPQHNYLSCDFFYPFVDFAAISRNPQKKPLYSFAYADMNSVMNNIYMVTAGVPIYIGDYYWGGIYCDVSLKTSQQLVATLNPGSKGFAVMVNAQGAVLIGSEYAFRVLFNKTADVTADYQLLQDSPFGDTTNLYITMKNISAGIPAYIPNFILSNTTYTVGYMKLVSLEDYIFIYFVPSIEISYSITVDKTLQRPLITRGVKAFVNITLTSASPKIIISEFSSHLFLSPISIEIPPQSTQTIELPLDMVPNYATTELHSIKVTTILPDEERCFTDVQVVPVEVHVSAGVSSVSAGTAIVAYILSGITVFIVLLGICYTYIKKDSYTIKAVNLVFCILTQMGAVLILLSPIFVVINTSAGCMIWMWFLGLGFTLFISPLVLKIYRLERIFDVSNWRVFAITNTQLLFGVAGFVGFQIVLLIIWSIVDPLQLKVLSLNDQENTQIKTCYTGDRTGPLFFIVELVFTALMLFVSCVLSVKIRNQKVGAVNESRELILTVYNIAVGIIVIASLAVVLVNNASSWALLISIGTTVVTTSSWGAMYVMKFWRIQNNMEQRNTSTSPKSSSARNTKTKSQQSANASTV